MYTVACIPFAPPTPVRLSLSGEGGDLKTQSPAVHIIFHCRAIHSSRGLLSSFSTTLTIYMHAVKATPMYSTEIHFMWRRQHSVSLRHDTNVKQNKLTTELEFYLPALSSKRNRPLQKFSCQCNDVQIASYLKKMLFANQPAQIPLRSQSH